MMKGAQFMGRFIVKGLAVVGGLYLAKTASQYALKKYKKEIRAYVINKVVDYFLVEEEGEEIDKNEILMMTMNAYLKQKGAK